jgi:RNA polymerase sigma-70 factor (TIGR02960 family)
MSTELIERARAGDQQAFEELVGPYQRELRVHCYRVLGSLADAEDGLQETLMAAWRGIGGYEGRASIRTWLYRIATSRCLNMLRSARRRPMTDPPRLEVEAPEPTRLGEVHWLEPFPDVLLEGLPDTTAGPSSRFEAREAISLAFVTALQLLPPRQRVALVLRDVLDFSAREVAGMLETSDQSVESALKRARATLAKELPSPEDAPPPAHSAAEQELLDRFVSAFEEGDVDGIVSLMSEDAWIRMPPVPLEYQGRELAKRFMLTVAFRQGRRHRLVPTRANGQPAFGVYLPDPVADVAHVFGIFVITLAGDQVSAITRFDNSTVGRFGLPRTLTD